MNAQCPKGHPFATGQVGFSIPAHITGLSMSGMLAGNVTAVTCNQCGHVYGVIHIPE